MKNREIKRPNMAMHIIIIFVAIICGCLFANYSFNIAKKYKDNINLETNYVLEYATIVEYKVRHSKNGSHYYTTYYEYIAPDNTKYTGVADLHLYDEEEAKAQIGKKVPVYIDHELHLQAESPEYRPSIGGAWFCGIASIICFLIMIISIVRLVRWRVLMKKIEKIQ